MNPLPRFRRLRGFSLLELMVVILCIGLLGALSYPAITSVVRLAEEAHTINNLKQMVTATMRWSADHGDKLPSPKYSGNEPDLPAYWDLGTDGEQGLWLNGVVFAAIYVEDPEDADGYATGEEDVDVSGPSNRATAGKHLVGTVFESRVSTKRNPSETNWFRHSFAMNANLMYDELALLQGADNPWFTQKLVSKFEPVASMLYIDCQDENIVMASDLGLILDTAEKRYDGKRIIAAFLDGHVSKMHPNDIPAGDPERNREASLFWRGIMPDR